MNINNIIIFIITTNADSNRNVHIHVNINILKYHSYRYCYLYCYCYAIKSLLALQFFDVYRFFDVGEGWPEGFEKGVQKENF